MRKFVSKVIGELYTKVVEQEFPDMEIQSFVKGVLDRYKHQSQSDKIEFSKN